MINPHLSVPIESQDEGTRRRTQTKTIFHYLHHNVATASMVAQATGVSQKNICRYKRDLEQCGRLWEVRRGICELTGFKAWYLTTDPDLRPATAQQLSLFGNTDWRVDD